MYAAKKKKHNLYSTSLHITLVILAGFTFTIITNIIIARWLNAQGFGDYSVALAVVNLLYIIALLGREQSILRQLPIYKQKKYFGLIHGFIVRNLQITIICSTAIAGISVLVWLLIYHAVTSVLPHTILLAFIMIPMLALVVYLEPIFISCNFTLFPLMLSELVFPSILIFILFFLKYHLHSFNEFHVINAVSISWSIVIIFSLFFLCHNILKPLKKYRKKYFTKNWLINGLPFLISNISIETMQQVTLILLELLYVNHAMVGIYAAVEGISFLLILLYMGIRMPMLTQIAKMIRMKDQIKLQIFLAKSLQIHLTLSGLFIIFIIIFGKIILLAFGTEFVYGYKLLCLMTVGYMTYVIFGLSIPILQFKGMNRLVFISHILMLFMNLLLCCLLIPLWGAYGATLAVIIPSGVVSIALAFIVKLRLNISLFTLR